MQQGRPPPAMTAEFLSAILEWVGDPVFVKDRDFRFVLVNQAFCSLAGRPRDELLGRTDFDLFPKDEAEAFRARDERVFASGEPDQVEETITAIGPRRTIATTKAPLRDEHGQVAFLVGVIHDISRLKQAEESLRQTKEGLERRVEERTAELSAAQDELVRKERFALLGQLAAGLAHQIRNPLASITNAGYLLQRALDSREEPDLSQPLEIILEEAWKADRIISGLLDHARVRSPERQRCRVLSLLDQVLAAHPPPDSVTVQQETTEVPDVSVDVGQTREALGNLVRNALDAMPKGGTLTLQAAAEPGCVVVAVTDTGPGIPVAQQRQLFRPLSTTKPHGLGLGLTTARMLLENQGATIAYVGIPGGGARFEVRLPLATD